MQSPLLARTITSLRTTPPTFLWTPYLEYVVKMHSFVQQQ